MDAEEAGKAEVAEVRGERQRGNRSSNETEEELTMFDLDLPRPPP